ncbi:regulatory protein, tetR family [Pedococcus dokdonensis]|uniref:Regulatory protein, tetR family n=1 Tax=Pedococcus dokdonensis TaxID=443156 RepID=A0A1H0QI51_9MICO|nr:TetR family transcriptional regulator [Pedococcus dokdonensis]SDP16429.1 regulatory protein, tetR family [Pedococcus dokdonensis]
MTELERSPRQRMVYEAAQALREDGLAGASLRTVAARADAPRGSLQHYFPGGKDQLVTEALHWAGEFAAAQVRTYLATARRPTPSGMFDDLVRGWCRELEARQFARGCPVAASVADASHTNPEVRAAAASALATWQEPLRAGLRAMGVRPARAAAHATLMLAALEGGLVLARAEHDTRPLRVVARELAPVLDAAAP